MKYAITLVIVLGWSVGVMWMMVYIFSTRDNLLQQLAADKVLGAENSTLAGATNTSRLLWMPRFLQEETLEQLGGEAVDAATQAQEQAYAAATKAQEQAQQAAEAVNNVSINSLFEHTSKPEWWLALLLPSCLYGFLIPLLDYVFLKLAVGFNNWENHKTESDYRNRLIAKVFSFRFVNCFVSLYYYAFSSEHSMLVLSVQLAGFVVASQVWNNLVEVVIPCVTRKWRRKRMRYKLEKAAAKEKGRRARLLVRQARSKAWQESQLPEYDTFEDYAEMCIQFGYVTFFSVAFPLAPLMAMLNNFVEIRGDAYKLCYNTQRPVATKSEGIGVWFNVLRLMSLMAVLTNCAHIAFTSQWLHLYFPWFESHDSVYIKLLIVFIFEVRAAQL